MVGLPMISYQRSTGSWLVTMVDRRQKRFESRARAARLRHQASIEDVDFRATRGLDRGLFLKLAGCDWIRARHGLLLTGPTGVGKSWLACALGHKACREDFSVTYHILQLRVSSFECRHRVPSCVEFISVAAAQPRFGARRSEGSSPSGADHRATSLYPVDPWGSGP